MFLDYFAPSELNYWGWAYPNFITSRNFDPITFLPSQTVDGVLYNNVLLYYGSSQLVYNFSSSPISVPLPAVADQSSSVNPQPSPPGQFLTGLTEDDVGGLCYLYSTNNIAYEELLPDIRCPHEFRGKLTDDAWRPGVDKLNFVPHPTDSKGDRFVPYVYSYDDKYLTNGVLITQRVERVVSTPDFLFSARNLTNPNDDEALLFGRTGTTNWINNAALNGSSEGGPGVITPQIKITFNTFGHFIFPNNTFSAQSYPYFWGSFDGSTNAPVVYPISPQGIKPYVVNMWLYFATGGFTGITDPYEWRLTNSIGSVSLFQTSTNLMNWVTMFSTTNDGTSWYFLNSNPTASQQFFRVVPQ
jgi:hypothetical protein